MKLLQLVILAIVLAACSSKDKETMSPIKVEIASTDFGYQLLRDGEPYTVRGAGMAIDDIERFAAHGGNSIRNWTTTGDHQSTQELLDAAYAHGVTVALCLSLKAERWGFDYDDADAVAAQLQAMREEVIKYRDHPALLVWIIGNELNHSYTNPRVWDAINDVARMIHELDPNHPATTATEGFKQDAIDNIATRAPDIDFVSFQLYGELFVLPERIAAAQFKLPFMVTEWGTVGYWEVDKTTWDAPIERTSSEKAGLFLRGQQEILDSLKGQLIGSYAFFWGQKQERTPTWFGVFSEQGEETEAVDALHYLWIGAWPDKRSPQVRAITLDGKDPKASVVLSPGARVEARIEVVDPDNDSLTYHWELKRESDATQVGGDHEESIANLDGLIENTGAANTFLAVPEPGKYRLFAYAYDGEGHAAHANIPFQVGDDASRQALLAGEVMAVAYSGFREGQHPDRGEGARNPSDDEILEDLQIMLTHGFKLIRLYDADENSLATLRIIREHHLPIKVLLGMWLKAEYSNHEGCPWLHEPIPDDELARNVSLNAEQVQRGIALAGKYDDIVIAVNVGNEALVDWNDHMVPVEKVIEYVRRVREQIDQPVTVADNYEWWKRDGAALAAEVDFVGIHTYPVWENKSIDEAMAYTIENIDGVRAALPDKAIVILEAGWATAATEFGERANEADQSHYFKDLRAWADATKTTIFFFEAFDEPWKGSEFDPLGAEKHWGLFNVDRTPKQAAREILAEISQ